MDFIIDHMSVCTYAGKGLHVTRLHEALYVNLAAVTAVETEMSIVC